MEKPIQRERATRSHAEVKDTSFHPYTITPESAETSVLLLESNEPEVLCQTLRAITKFSAQDLGNRQILFNLDATQAILRHIEHPETNVRRYALKALAQLCQLPRGPEQVLGNPANLRKIASMLSNSKVEDVYILEFSSLILAELTREPLGCEQLSSVNILGSLFSKMKDMQDPDIQKNCLQIVSNLLSDPTCAAEVTKSQYFSWDAILALLKSKYLEIQDAALKTVDQLVCRYNDMDVQKSFRVSAGVSDLCDMLDSYELRDVHTRVLNVLRNYAETEENASHMYQSGGLQRLVPYLDMAMTSVKPHCIAVLTKLSYTAEGRNALFQTGTDLLFCNKILESHYELLADAALGVANMTKLFPSALRMAETGVTEALCSLLPNDDPRTPWFDVKMNALIALGELCRATPKAADSLVEPTAFNALRDINKKYKDNPIEAQRLAVQCYKNLLDYTVSTRAMLNSSFISELISILRRPDIHLKILTCTVLAGLMKENIARVLFNSYEGEKVVSTNLSIEHVGLRTALCQLIAASCNDDGADVYLDLGTIHYMVENRAARYAVSAWESALETMFRHNASAQLAYTGRLDINDYTQDGFYVEKRPSARFPCIREVLERGPPHREPVFVCMFANTPPAPPHPSGTHPRQYSAASSTSAAPGRKRPSLSSHDRLSAYEGLPEDTNLHHYLKKLQEWLGDPAKSMHLIELEDGHFDVRYRAKCQEVSSTLKEKGELLAQFVVEQMCGVTQDRDCSVHSVDLHLADLVAHMNSPVLGIGWVRCGGALERAVLYKVLADRVGVPCALYRARTNHAWCEIAVPELRLTPSGVTEDGVREARYPAGLLRANYVVDLMRAPGTLVPKGSYEADDICGNKH